MCNEVIQRTHKMRMDLPIELKIATEKLIEGYKQAQLKKVFQKLSERYRYEGGEGKKLLSQYIEAVVYSLVRLPATFGAVTDAIQYSLEYFDGEIESLLDVGAGTGAATWAIVNALSIKQVTCLEREKVMRQVGEMLMKEGSDELINAKWISADLTSSDIVVSADLVVSSYVINEMAKEDRQKVLENLWNATNKMLLIVEPGTPAGFGIMKEARGYILSKGGYVLAPCPHMGECKISDDDWCHFTCRVQRSKIHKLLKEADVAYEDEKYSYMAFVKEEISGAKARILRHPYIEKGKISLELCGHNENKKVSITKKDGKLFKIARKAKHGDSIDIDC